MKKKNTIKIATVVATSMLILSGCSLSPTNYAPTSSLSTQSKSTVKLTEKEYTDTMVNYETELSDELRKFAETYKTVDGKVDQAWLDTNASQAKLILATVSKMKAVNPPDAYKDIQSAYVDAMNSFDQGFNVMLTGFEQRDVDKFDEAKPILTKAQDEWNYAYAKLQTVVDVPMGDGTITSKDLKDLDKNAGIDRDSVLNNISKDGKELIGKWGREMEDGSVNVSIVLNADGSYEGYGNGQYPSKDNAFIGTWKYDYLTHTISFKNDTYYKDGKLVTPIPRETMEMDVESFSNGKIQMLDVLTWNRFHYKKQTSLSEAITPISSSISSASRVTTEQLIGLWSGINDDLLLGLTLYEDGTFLRGELVTGKAKIWIRGTWSFDERNQSIRFVNESVKYGKDDTKVSDYPADTSYRLITSSSSEITLDYDNGNEITIKK